MGPSDEAAAAAEFDRLEDDDEEDEEAEEAEDRIRRSDSQFITSPSVRGPLSP